MNGQMIARINIYCSYHQASIKVPVGQLDTSDEDAITEFFDEHYAEQGCSIKTQVIFS